MHLDCTPGVFITSQTGLYITKPETLYISLKITKNTTVLVLCVLFHTLFYHHCSFFRYYAVRIYVVDVDRDVVILIKNLKES